MIPVYIVAGLLDSGKTSFIESTLLQQDWMAEGNTLYLICEEGEYALPDSLRMQKRIVPCPMDSPENFRTEYLNELTEKFTPAQIIIEFNGMWNLKDFLQRDFPSDWGLAGIYSLVNGEELELVMTNMRNLFMNQHTESDLIIVNRCRPDTNRVKFRKAIKLQNPIAQIVFESVTGEVIEFGEEDLPYDVKADAFQLDDEDYGTWFADASEFPERYVRKKITFLAQFYRPLGMPRNMFIPGRRVMACCAEDVQFYGFPCKTEEHLSFQNKSWHMITAEFGLEKRKDPRTKAPVQAPVLRFIRAEDAEPPAEEVVTL